MNCDPNLAGSQIFLIGNPRSGTTLTQKFLVNTFEVFSFPESHYFDFLYPKSIVKKITNLTSNSKFKQNINNFLDKYPSASHLKSEFNKLSKSDYDVFFYRMLNQIALNNNYKNWVEKTPRHLFYIQKIESLCPNPIFIHIIRNGIDSIASHYHQASQHPDKWGGKKNLNYFVKRWRNAIIEHSKYKHKPNHYYFLQDNYKQEQKFLEDAMTNIFEIPIRKSSPSNIVLFNQEEVWKNDTKMLDYTKPNYISEVEKVSISEQISDLNIVNIFRS